MGEGKCDSCATLRRERDFWRRLYRYKLFEYSADNGLNAYDWQGHCWLSEGPSEADIDWILNLHPAYLPGLNEKATRRFLGFETDDDDLEGFLIPPRSEIRPQPNPIPPRPVVTEKQCSRCKETKPADQFAPHSKLKDGLNCFCRDCALAISAKANQARIAKQSAAAPIPVGREPYDPTPRKIVIDATERPTIKAAPASALETKVCGKCGDRKPLSEFRPHKGTKDGLSGLCGPCKSGVSAANAALRGKYSIPQKGKKAESAHPAADEPKSKVCIACGNEKPISEYSRVGGRGVNPNLRKSKCRTCIGASIEAVKQANRAAQHPITEPEPETRVVYASNGSAPVVDEAHQPEPGMRGEIDVMVRQGRYLTRQALIALMSAHNASEHTVRATFGEFVREQPNGQRIVFAMQRIQEIIESGDEISGDVEREIGIKFGVVPFTVAKLVQEALSRASRTNPRKFNPANARVVS